MPPTRLYVLASHEPNRDPRVDWVARFAADRWQTVVFGMAEPQRPEYGSEQRHGYRIERLTRSSTGLALFLWTLARTAAGRQLWPALLAGMVASPLVLIPWLARTLGRSILVPLARLAVPKPWRPALRRRFIPDPLERRLRAMDTWRSRKVFLVRHFLTTSATLHREIHRAPPPGLLYCNDLDTLLGGVVLKARFGCKLVYDAHEFWAHADPLAPWWEVRFFLFLERTLLRRVDAAFTVSHLLADKMRLALDHPFMTLPNCAPLDDAPASRSAHTDREIETLGEGRVRFLFQGGFAPARGIEELLMIWRHVAPEKAVLFLRGPDNPDRARYVDFARVLGLLDRTVFFLEPILESDLVARAAAADVGVIPYTAATINYRYCCPNKLSQYMQAGLAILANEHLEFLRDALDRYQCGLTYDAHDEARALAAVNRLIDDAALREVCQRRSRSTVGDEYNWQRQSVTLYKTCERLLAAPARPPASGLSAPEEQKAAC